MEFEFSHDSDENSLSPPLEVVVGRSLPIRHFNFWEVISILSNSEHLAIIVIDDSRIIDHKLTVQRKETEDTDFPRI
jgi:hypothetical protein